MSATAISKEAAEAHRLIPTINAHYKAFHKSSEEAIENAISIGQLLLQMKEALPHGEFTEAIESRCEFEIRWGQICMKVAAGKKLLDKMKDRPKTIEAAAKAIAEASPKKTQKRTGTAHLPGGAEPAASNRQSVPISPPAGSVTAAHEEKSTPLSESTTEGTATATATESDDPIGDNCTHEWDEDGCCKLCKIDKTVLNRPSGGATFNPAEWSGDGKDGTGKEHDGAMKRVFETASEFDGARQNLVNLKKWLNRVKGLPGGEMIQSGHQRIMADLNNLDAEIKFAQPFAPCCYCKAADKTCKACKGMGWLAETAHKAAPKEKKRATA